MDGFPIKIKATRSVLDQLIGDEYGSFEDDLGLPEDEVQGDRHVVNILGRFKTRVEVRDPVELRNVLESANYMGDKWIGNAVDFDTVAYGNYGRALIRLHDRLRAEAERRGVEILPYRF